MNTLKWNKSKIQNDFSDCNNLSEVVGSLEQKLWAEEQVICQIHVNGMFLSESDEKKFANTLVNEIDDLQVMAKAQDELTTDSILSVIDWLPQVSELCLNVSGLLRIQDERAESGFMNVVENIHYLSEALSLLKPRVYEVVENDAHRQEWRQLEEGFKANTMELSSAFEKGDMILVGDILEYELTMLFEGWVSLLKRTRPEFDFKINSLDANEETTA